MKRFISLFALCFLFLSAGCSGQAMPTVTVAEMPPTPVFASGSETTPVPETSFDAARAYEDNRKLAVDIGKRVAGTPGEQAAADYIAGEFQKSGLQVSRQPFPFQSWQDHGTTVALVGSTPSTLDAQPIQYSIGGKVEGEVVLVPNLGSRDDFSKVDVKGKIALVKRGTLPFSDKSNNAAEVGATAILIYNDAPESFTGTLRDKVTIPTIALSGVSGQALIKMLGSGNARVQIASDTSVVEQTGYNVIGKIQGKTDETIVLGGHYDTVSVGPGAGDNGSGTATLIELARVMGSRPQPQHTLVFIAFDAEELGLVGSRAYVDGLSNAQVQNIRAMLNFDMLGAGSGPLLLMGDGNVALLGRSSAKQLNIDARNGQLPANAGSDHQSFARRGVDTVFFMRDYNLLHTPQDTIDQVHQEYLGEAGRVAERLLERLDASTPPSESSRLMPTR